MTYKRKKGGSTLQDILSSIMGFVLVALLVVSSVTTALASEPELLGDAQLDLERPSDVSNLQAQPGDSSVELSWDVATDNQGVSGYIVEYGLEPVTSEGGQYMFDINVGDVIEYTVDGLDNGVEYYFAVSAYDEAGNESENYSNEASASPEFVEVEEETASVDMGDDGKAPTVKAAESYSNVQIRVEFSEPVQLPEEEPQTAFLVSDNLTGELLPLFDAVVLDDEPKVVVVETSEQEVGAEYILTAGVAVEDNYGHPVSSGTSDTATFLGEEGDYIPVNVHDEDGHDHDDDHGHSHDHEDHMEKEIMDEFGDLLSGLSDVAPVGDMSDAEVEEMLEEMVGILEGMDSMSDEESMDAFGRVMEIRIQLDAIPEERINAIFDSRPDLKEVIENAEAASSEVADSEMESEMGDLEDDMEMAEGPAEVLGASALSSSEIEVNFSAPVEFLESQSHFLVSDAEGAVYNVASEELSEDGMSAVITVDDLSDGESYMLAVMNVIDSESNVVDAGPGLEFIMPETFLTDVIAPEDITELMAKVEGMIVTLSWEVSVSEDAVEQVVYQSTDGSVYTVKAVLPPLTDEFEVADLIPGVKYWLKITSKDAAGNESDGVVVEVMLPETGPALPVMFGITALAVGAIRRKKKF